MKKNKTTRLITGFIFASCALVTSGLLSSCAYTDTMNERNVEGVQLQNELNYEVDRGKKLSR